MTYTIFVGEQLTEVHNIHRRSAQNLISRERKSWRERESACEPTKSHNDLKIHAKPCVHWSTELHVFAVTV